MTDEASRIRGIETIEETIAASVRLREGLVLGEEIGRSMIQNIRRGIPISETVERSGAVPATIRRSTNELLEEFERCRHRMRLAFIPPSLDEGMSIGDVGRTLGVSRQLVSRLVHEATEPERRES